MNTRELQEADLQLLKNLEHSVFPFGDGEGNNEIYLKWIEVYRNLSLIFEEESEIQGLVSVIPLNKKGWDFIYNKNERDVEEYDLVNEYLFDINNDSEIGIYIYMIQKINTELEFFTKTAYKEIFKRIKSKFGYSIDNILGIAGYSVSPEAINVALNKLGRLEVKPIDMFMFKNSSGETIVREVSNQSDFNKAINEGLSLRNRCRLSAVTPKDPSPVWEWFEESKS